MKHVVSAKIKNENKDEKKRLCVANTMSNYYF